MAEHNHDPNCCCWYGMDEEAVRCPACSTHGDAVRARLAEAGCSDPKFHPAHCKCLPETMFRTRDFDDA